MYYNILNRKSLLVVALTYVNIMRTAALSTQSLATNRKTAIVTGSTDGIGVTTAKNLAVQGFNVIIHGRDENRIKRAVKEVQSFAGVADIIDNQIFTVEADISTIRGCQSFVQNVKDVLTENNLTLDILMNNAGVFEQDYRVTEDALEMTFAVNVMAPFIITSNLLSKLLEPKSHQSRIVIASSISQCRSIDHWDDLQCNIRQYSTHRAYSESKLLDAMLAAEMGTRLENAGIGKDRITCNSLDPGTVNTKMLLAGWGPCGIDVEDALGK